MSARIDVSVSIVHPLLLYTLVRVNADQLNERFFRNCDYCVVQNFTSEALQQCDGAECFGKPCKSIS